jgi:hypothetical protein
MSLISLVAVCGLVVEDVDEGVGDEKESVSKDNASE